MNKPTLYNEFPDESHFRTGHLFNSIGLKDAMEVLKLSKTIVKTASVGTYFNQV